MFHLLVFCSSLLALHSLSSMQDEGRLTPATTPRLVVPHPVLPLFNLAGNALFHHFFSRADQEDFDLINQCFPPSSIYNHSNALLVDVRTRLYLLAKNNYYGTEWQPYGYPIITRAITDQQFDLCITRLRVFDSVDESKLEENRMPLSMEHLSVIPLLLHHTILNNEKSVQKLIEYLSELADIYHQAVDLKKEMPAHWRLPLAKEYRYLQEKNPQFNLDAARLGFALAFQHARRFGFTATATLLEEAYTTVSKKRPYRSSAHSFPYTPSIELNNQETPYELETQQFIKKVVTAIKNKNRDQLYELIRINPSIDAWRCFFPYNLTLLPLLLDRVTPSKTSLEGSTEDKRRGREYIWGVLNGAYTIKEKTTLLLHLIRKNPLEEGVVWNECAKLLPYWHRYYPLQFSLHALTHAAPPLPLNLCTSLITPTVPIPLIKATYRRLAALHHEEIHSSPESIKALLASLENNRVDIASFLLKKGLPLAKLKLDLNKCATSTKEWVSAYQGVHIQKVRKLFTHEKGAERVAQFITTLDSRALTAPVNSQSGTLPLRYCLLKEILKHGSECYSQMYSRLYRLSAPIAFIGEWLHVAAETDPDLAIALHKTAKKWDVENARLLLQNTEGLHIALFLEELLNAAQEYSQNSLDEAAYKRAIAYFREESARNSLEQ